MCGINGILDYNALISNNLNKKINSMNNDIIHRGPDSSGIFTEINQNYSIALGMRRLSIIDLSNGDQPFYSDDGNIVLIFNGEIYNYLELKNKLNLKYKFKTNSDTEVILKLYEEYGKNCFEKLDGMYSISLYDKLNKKLFLARDYFGEKPLYYYFSKNKFIWASELKSIINNFNFIPSINKDALNLYFQLTYIPAPHTIYEDIYKLNSNSFLEFDIQNSSYKLHETFKSKKENIEEIKFENAKKTTHDLIFESVESRMVSDVPVGTFLSGGVDSSIITLCASSIKNNIDTFSIGFENKKYDETSKSRLVSKLVSSNHHEHIFTANELENSFEKIILNFDEPFADSSALPTFLVSEIASKNLKVVLTGDGGDEVFGGYNKYYIGKLNSIYTKNISESKHENLKNLSNSILKIKNDNRGFLFKTKKIIDSIDYHNQFYKNIISLGFNEEETLNLLNKKYHSNELNTFFIGNKVSTVKDFRNIDKKISLEGDMLTKVDRASMLNSLECRAPFLNKKLWDFTNSLPDKYLIKNWNKKYLLKKTFESYFPSNFLDKSKKGFALPIGDWLRYNLKNEALSFVNKEFIKKQGIFNYDYIYPIVIDHINKKNDNTFKVWTFYCFQKWYLNSYLKS